MSNKQSKINAKSNKIFKRLSKSEKRVAIANDVLALLKKEKIKACSGTFCSFSITKFTKAIDNQSKINEKFIELSKPMKNVHCEVCALGALFVSGLNKFNNLKVRIDSLDNRSEFRMEDNCFSSFLLKYFSQKQSELIESFFEGGLGYYDDHHHYGDGDLHDLQNQLYNKLSDKDRLILIMKNIITNKGTFVPALVKFSRQLQL